MGLQMREVNVIKDASCCRLQRKCLFHSFLNAFVELSLSVCRICLCVFVSCLNVLQFSKIFNKRQNNILILSFYSIAIFVLCKHFFSQAHICKWRDHNTVLLRNYKNR